MITFRLKAQEETKIIEIMKLFKTNNEIVQEIHDSFDNAQEVLLKQSNEIINACDKKSTDKAIRLMELGFNNSEPVVQKKINDQILLSSEKDANLVMRYKHNYPFLKFLKEDQLDEICDKYGLIYAPVGRYKKDVPNKNLSEIESAQPLNKKDNGNSRFFISVRGFWDWGMTMPIKLRRILKRGFYIPEEKNVIESDLIVLAKKYAGYTGNYSGFVTSCDGTIRVEKEKRDGLFIAAPKSHFDLNGLKNKKNGFFNVSITTVKDPIVFRYVKGGIQVLSKWGLEASDQLLVNEKMN